MEEKKYGYLETKDFLDRRIETYKKYGERDIEPWLLKHAKVSAGSRMLDVGCGSGKQIELFGKTLGSKGFIIGCDIQQDLLEAAQRKITEQKLNALVMHHDMNKNFPFVSGSFTHIISGFSAYYVDDAEAMLREFLRLLSPGGDLFIFGPGQATSENFWQLQAKTSGYPINPISIQRRARLQSEFVPLIKKRFINVQTDTFMNTIRYPNAAGVINYYVSSLVFQEGVPETARANAVTVMEDAVKRVIEEKGYFEDKKEVIAITARKGG